MKITSRIDEENNQREQLLNIIKESVSEEDFEDIIDCDTLELISQVSMIQALLLTEIEHLSSMNSSLLEQVIERDISLSYLQKAISDIPYDEDLDNATTDMIEAFLASSMTEVTFDGDKIIFTPNSIFSKSEFKPIAREVINSWIQAKIVKN